MIWFSIWVAIKMIGISVTIVSVNYAWSNSYAAADNMTKTLIRNNIDIYFSVWDCMLFVLLIAFLFGSIFFGWATWKSKGLEKKLSYIFWFAVPLTISIILDGYAGQSWAEMISEYVNPFLQPCSRMFMVALLWRNSEKGFRYAVRLHALE